MLGALLIQPAKPTLHFEAYDDNEESFLEKVSIASHQNVFTLSSMMKTTVLSGSLEKASEGSYSYHDGLSNVELSAPSISMNAYTTSDIVIDQPSSPRLVKLTSPTVSLENTTSALNIQCYLSGNSSLDPDMVGQLEMALKSNSTINKADFEKKARTMTLSELEVLCGVRVPDVENSGCMWNKTELLESTFRQGLYHSRKGIARSAAFSLYAHAQILISSRLSCAADSESDFVSIPFNYEAMYGVMSAKISSTATSLGMQLTVAPLTDAQENTLNNLTQQALTLRPEGVTFTESFFPTKTEIPDPVAALEDSTAPNESDTITSYVRSNDFSAVTAAFCGSEHFKYEFSGPNLSDPEQHCCNEGCSLIAAFQSNGDGVYAGLSSCCGLCNKKSCSCDSTEDDTMIISGGSIVTITNEINGYATIVYFSI